MLAYRSPKASVTAEGIRAYWDPMIPTAETTQTAYTIWWVYDVNGNDTTRIVANPLNGTQQC